MITKINVTLNFIFYLNKACQLESLKQNFFFENDSKKNSLQIFEKVSKLEVFLKLIKSIINDILFKKNNSIQNYYL